MADRYLPLNKVKLVKSDRGRKPRKSALPAEIIADGMPLLLNTKHYLVDGFERYHAYKQLKYSDVPITITDPRKL